MSLVIVEFKDKEAGKPLTPEQEVEIEKRLRDYKPHYKNVYSLFSDTSYRLAIESKYEFGGVKSDESHIIENIHRDIIQERISDLEVKFQIKEVYRLVTKKWIKFMQDMSKRERG